ncbi:MAG: HAD family hydrolase [Defluviitaleaceae bacterium]|nr:HAD family hydrolase [Defluviitaleaceae bacterium]
MKTLYISDLDGTLLNKNERVSAYTAEVINRFVLDGGCFSYATARSLATSSVVTGGLNLQAPVICNNGALIRDSKTGKILLSQNFDNDDVAAILQTLTSHNISPIVYGFIEGVEKFTFIPHKMTAQQNIFLSNRQNDPRRRETESEIDLCHGKIHNFACLGEATQLLPIHNHFKSSGRISSIYQKETYFDAHWCEILPTKATKAAAALELKKILNCDRIIAFGDNMNDIPLFSVADESYAVENAVPELKKLATGIIAANEDNGVAKYMAKSQSKGARK